MRPETRNNTLRNKEDNCRCYVDIFGTELLETGTRIPCFMGWNFVCMQVHVLTTACTPAIVTFIVVEIRVSWLRILSLELVYQACLD